MPVTSRSNLSRLNKSMDRTLVSVITPRPLEDTSMTPNRRLKQARELRGWSQAKVAEQIGTDATTVSRWERGMFFPTPYFRERLCALFEKNAEELGLLEAVVDQPLVSDR